jgi:signal transduction histidine kinase
MFTGATRVLKNSIGFKLMRSVLYWYVLCAVFLFAAQLFVMYQDEKVSIEARAKNELINLSSMMYTPLSLAIEKKDPNAIREIIRTLSNNPSVQRIEIKSPVQPDLNQELNISNKLPESKWITFSSELLSSIRGNQTLLGTLSLSTSVKYGFFSVITNTMIASVLIHTLVKLVVVGFLMLWASEHYISRPLDKFTKSVEKIELEKLHKVNIADAETEENEIKKLQNVFNSLIERLDKAVDARENYQLALEGSEKYLSAILDAMPSVLVGVNAKGNIVHSNTEARKISAIPLKEDSVDQLFIACFPFLKEHEHLIQTAIHEKTTQTVQKIKIVKELEDNDKEERYLNLLIYPVLLQDSGVIVRMDDVTERVRLENAMVQTEKMTSLGTLSAGIAHEINNPLGGILQGAQNIHRRLDPTKPKNQEVAKECGVALENVLKYMEKREILVFLKGITDMGERAANIVKNVLRFSRSSAADMQMVSVHQIIESAIMIILTSHDIRRQSDFRKIEIVRLLDPDIPLISCSPLEIEQVLLNLLKNAGHAVMSINASGSDPQIVIHTRKTSDMVYIEIKDNGPGIDKYVKKRIFEPFFTTKAVGTGTGLGLSISYRIIVDKHHGSIDIESEVGEGTKFIIGLPIKQPTASEPTKATLNSPDLNKPAPETPTETGKA